MEPFEIEYLDTDGGGRAPDAGAGRTRATADARFAALLCGLGCLLAVVALIAAVALAVTYEPEHGDPMNQVASDFSPERGVPPAADLVLGAIGVALGLALVAFGRLLANAADTSTSLAVIARVLTEMQAEATDGGSG